MSISIDTSYDPSSEVDTLSTQLERTSADRVGMNDHEDIGELDTIPLLPVGEEVPPPMEERH